MTITLDHLGYPVATTTGIRCGGSHLAPTRHENVAAVRYCYQVQADHDAQAREELAAEAATERYFEDRGYWAARADEDMEAARGVIPFDQAYADAMA